MVLSNILFLFYGNFGLVKKESKCVKSKKREKLECLGFKIHDLGQCKTIFIFNYKRLLVSKLKNFETKGSNWNLELKTLLCPLSYSPLNNLSKNV